MKKGMIACMLIMMAICAGCGGNGTVDANEVKQIYVSHLPTAKEKADIYVEPIEGLPDDFIRGMDVSTVIVEEESGVTY
ncbi:MAG: hypothetical protein II477_07800, partial [Lachnospiraceae bacterium]|nr:hypothetical protein [Lachnospiraceae bacterium]